MFNVSRRRSFTVRLLLVVWRSLRVGLVAFAAFGPAPPPPPLPRREVPVLIAERVQEEEDAAR